MSCSFLLKSTSQYRKISLEQYFSPIPWSFVRNKIYSAKKRGVIIVFRRFQIKNSVEGYLLSYIFISKYIFLEGEREILIFYMVSTAQYYKHALYIYGFGLCYVWFWKSYNCRNFSSKIYVRCILVLCTNNLHDIVFR